MGEKQETPRYRKVMYVGHALLILGLIANVTDGVINYPLVWVGAAVLCWVVAGIGYVTAGQVLSVL